MNIQYGLYLYMMLSFVHKCACRPAKHDRNIRQARIDAIKGEILLKLGLSSVPDVSRVNTTRAEKRRMIQLYKRSILDNEKQVHELFHEEEFFAKTFHSFQASGLIDHRRSDIPSSWIRENPSFHFRVNFPEPEHHNRELHLHSAKFKVYKYRTYPERLADSEERDVAVSVYLVHHSHRHHARKLITSRVVSLVGTGWEEFDVSTAVKHWLDKPTKYISLQIVCESHHISDLMEFLTVHPEQVTMNEIAPSLDVYVQEKDILGRRRRSPEVHDCVKGDGENRCCRYPLWVSFEEIGWDSWVVAPIGYQAYYCDGGCPHQYKSANTFASIKSAMRMINPAAAPEPCCSSTTLSPLSLVHYDDSGRLKVSRYSDMIVEGCQCT